MVNSGPKGETRLQPAGLARPWYIIHLPVMSAGVGVWCLTPHALVRAKQSQDRNTCQPRDSLPLQRGRSPATPRSEHEQPLLAPLSS